jgi:hypothetical protein
VQVLLDTLKLSGAIKKTPEVVAFGCNYVS